MKQAKLAGSDGLIDEAMVADSDHALMLRATWLYYIEERTQGDIADALNITRFRVNRMLAECRDRGFIRVEVCAPLASCVALERRAVAAFGLRDAIIVPSPMDPDRSSTMIGAGLARYMSQMIADPAAKIFGIGWGQTMREMLRYLAPCERPEAKVVTLLGALPRSSEENSIEIISKFGRMLSGERYYMTAPIYADSPEAHAVFAAQQFYAATQELILAADVACFGVGDMSRQSLLIRHALPRGVTVDELKEAGAVGDLLGTFIDIDGKPIDHPINSQLLGPDLEDLRAMKSLVMASGGANKTGVVTGALRSGLVDVLVCDETTIRAVLDHGAENV